MSKWPVFKIKQINQYKGNSVNPALSPNLFFELYSVPSFDNDFPEIVKGAQIGSTKQSVQKGDVLLCKINPRINRVWCVAQYTNNPLIASSEWIIIRNQNIHSKYLQWYLKSDNFRNLIMAHVTGIGGSLTRAQPKQVGEYPIPVPPFDLQKKIADVLDKAKSLIDLRKKQIEKMDLLIKSKFIEMFGDPVTNPFGFETRCLRELYDSTDSIKCGPFGSALKKGEYVASGIPVWVMDNITKQGNFNDFVFLWITQEKYCELSSYKVRNGDVIISRAGTVGKMCVVNSKYDESIISTNLVRLRLGRDLVPLYFVFLITIFGNKICRFSTGQDGAFTHMNTTVLNSIQFPYPPISLQKKFVSFVDSVEKHKLLQQQALNKMEMNYKSLMQEYFG